MSSHIGRSWHDTRLEDDCPCVKESCGLVDQASANPACTEHPIGRFKTIRQSHDAADCPAREDLPMTETSDRPEPRLWLGSTSAYRKTVEHDVLFTRQHDDAFYDVLGNLFISPDLVTDLRPAVVVPEEPSADEVERLARWLAGRDAKRAGYLPPGDDLWGHAGHLFHDDARGAIAAMRGGQS